MKQLHTRAVLTMKSAYLRAAENNYHTLIYEGLITQTTYGDLGSACEQPPKCAEAIVSHELSFHVPIASTEHLE